MPASQVSIVCPVCFDNYRVIHREDCSTCGDPCVHDPALDAEYLADESSSSLGTVDVTCPPVEEREPSETATPQDIFPEPSFDQDLDCDADISTDYDSLEVTSDISMPLSITSWLPSADLFAVPIFCSMGSFSSSFVPLTLTSDSDSDCGSADYSLSDENDDPLLELNLLANLMNDPWINELLDIAEEIGFEPVAHLLPRLVLEVFSAFSGVYVRTQLPQIEG